MCRTWRQQETTMSLMWLLLQKRVSIPTSCVRTFVDFLVHDNVELRKVAFSYFSIDFAYLTLCRLLKKALQPFVVYKSHLEYTSKRHSTRFFNDLSISINVVQVIAMTISGSPSMTTSHLHLNNNGKKLVS